MIIMHILPGDIGIAADLRCVFTLASDRCLSIYIIRNKYLWALFQVLSSYIIPSMRLAIYIIRNKYFWAAISGVVFL